MGSAEKLHIQRVRNKADLNIFIDLVAPLYESDPHWIAPLRLERQQHLSPAHNPYFQHARWEAWVAWRGGRPVGRVSAQVDELYLERYGEATGFFGMVEAEDDGAVFAALFQTAEGWLREQGMARAMGPFNLSINQECGLLVQGFETPPSVMMPHGRPYYEARIREQGYAPMKDLLAYHVAPDFAAPPVMQGLVRRYGERLVVRSLRRRHLAAELELLRELFNDAWSVNWGFVPFTEAEFQAIGKDLMLLVGDDLVQLAELEGEPVAFIVALPNVNEAIRDFNGRLFPLNWAKLLWRLKVRCPRTARVPLMGVRQRYQQTRLGPGLAFLVIDAVRQGLIRRGVRDVELSWILEDNAGMRNIIEHIGGEVSKTYRIFDKNLARG
jgi:hypothetical protein